MYMVVYGDVGMVIWGLRSILDEIGMEIGDSH